MYESLFEIRLIVLGDFGQVSRKILFHLNLGKISQKWSLCPFSLNPDSYIFLIFYVKEEVYEYSEAECVFLREK